MTSRELETWELWFPNAAANGLLFARSRIDQTRVLWIHAAPAVLAVTVRNHLDHPIAHEGQLTRQGPQLPMTRLNRTEAAIERHDGWPTSADLGSLVVLPGGEVGVLLEWWNADDHSEWRWRVEFYNHR